MLTLRTALRSLPVALLTAALLGTSGALARPADPPDALGTQLSAMAGSGLMLAGCQDRLQALGSLLGQVGFGPMRSQVMAGTSLVARWYHPQRHTTVVAFAGWQDSGNAFSATEFAGPLRWNELVGTP